MIPVGRSITRVPKGGGKEEGSGEEAAAGTAGRAAVATARASSTGETSGASKSVVEVKVARESTGGGAEESSVGCGIG